MTSAKFSGVIPAIATPITAEGYPDEARFVALAKYLLAKGADGLNVLGTTGEATSFSVGQRKRLMSAAAKAGLPVEKFMVGTGAAATADAIELTRHAGELGFAGALVLPPFYYKDLSHDGVTRYIEALIEATRDSQLPILLYNYPALSGVRYDLELIALLLKRFGERIAGLKDSSGDLAYAASAAALSKAFAVFPSNEAVLLDARAGAFAGCISATANLNADLCAEAFGKGNAKALSVAVAIRGLFKDVPLVAGVKSLLAHIHQDKNLSSMMPPLVPLDAAAASSIARRYDELRREAA